MKKYQLSLLAFIFISLNLFAQVPSNGLVAYYKFSGNAKDSSGYGNHGVVNGATLTTDRFGNANSAYHFNGSSDYISVAANNSIQPTTSVSLSAWICPESSNNQWGPIVSKRYYSANDPYDSYGLHWGNVASPYNNKYYFTSSNGTVGSGRNAIQKNTLSLNTWYMLTGVNDGSTLKLYINGVLDTSIAFSGNLSYTSMALYIANNSQANQFFKGKIDDISIHNRALTSTEVLNMFNQTNTNPINPSNDIVAWYKFNGNANDTSGYNNHGVVYGAKLTSDRFGNPNGAYYFNGINNQINVANSASLQPQLVSISAWICPDSNANQWIPIVEKRYDALNDPWSSYGMYTSGPNTPSPYTNKYFNGVSNGTVGSTRNCLSTSNSNLGTWSHLVTTYDGVNVKLYVNGVLESTTPMSGNIGYSNMGLYIGANAAAGQLFKGKIDEVIIYNRALTALEVSAMYTPIASNILSGSHAACSGIPALPILGSVPAGGFTSSIYSYTWIASTTSANAGYSIASGVSNTQNYLPGVLANSTWYKRIVQSGSSIDTSAAFLISLYASPNVSALANPSQLCQGEFVTFTGAGALSYVWSGGIINGVPFKANASGTFNVIGTDANGCSDTASQTITVNPLPNVIAHATVNPVCSGTSTTLFGSGAASYSWSNNVQNNVAFVPSITTNYTLTGTDSLGCSNTATQLITVNAMPDKSISVNGSTITAIEIGATYQWLNCANGKSPIMGATGRSLTDSTNGSYAVVVSKNNCSDTSSCVTVNASGIENIASKNSFIKVFPNPNNGSFSVIANSEENILITNELGQVVLSFSLNRNNNYTQQINNLNNGIYFVIGNKIRSKIVVAK